MSQFKERERRRKAPLSPWKSVNPNKVAKKKNKPIEGVASLDHRFGIPMIAPFFIIFCVHSGLVSLRFWLILVCICTFATSSETGGYMWLCYRLQMPLRHELERESYKFQI